MAKATHKNIKSLTKLSILIFNKFYSGNARNQANSLTNGLQPVLNYQKI